MNLELIKTQLHNKTFTKSNNFTNNFYKELNINQVKIINVLLFIFSSYKNYYKNDSKNLNNICLVMKNEGSFEIEYKRLLEFLHSNYKNKNFDLVNLKEELEDIRKKSLRYRKIENEVLREVYTSFILKFEILTKKEDLTLNSSRVRFTIDKELFEDIFNYNRINGYNLYSIEVTKLQSKLAISLYELLTKFLKTKYVEKDKNHKKIKDKNLLSKNFTLDEINTLLNVNYKYLSQILIDIKKQYENIKKENLLDLEDREFLFKIENKLLKIELQTDKFSTREFKDLFN